MVVHNFQKIIFKYLLKLGHNLTVTVFERYFFKYTLFEISNLRTYYSSSQPTNVYLWHNKYSVVINCCMSLCKNWYWKMLRNLYCNFNYCFAFFHFQMILYSMMQTYHCKINTYDEIYFKSCGQTFNNILQI